MKLPLLAVVPAPPEGSVLVDGAVTVAMLVAVDVLPPGVCVVGALTGKVVPTVVFAAEKFEVERLPLPLAAAALVEGPNAWVAAVPPATVPGLPLAAAIVPPLLLLPGAAPDELPAATAERT